MSKLLFGSLLRFRNFLFMPIFLFVLSAVLFCNNVQAAVEKPEQKIWDSLVKFGNVTSFSFNGSMTYTGKASYSFTNLLLDPMVANKKVPAKYESITVDIKGAKQIITPLQSQSWAAFTTKSSDKKAPALGMEIRSISDKTYLALISAKNMPAEINGFLNTWVQLDFGSLLKDFKLDQMLGEKVRTESKLGSEKEKLQQLRDLFLKSKVLTLRSRYTQKINGAYFDVYSVAINKNNLKKFLVASKDVVDGHVFSIQQLANLDKEIARTKTISAKIWIGRKDGYPYRVDITAVGNQVKEKTVMQINLKDFNQPISVYEPASFLTLEELFNQLFPNIPSLVGTSTDPTSSLGW